MIESYNKKSKEIVEKKPQKKTMATLRLQKDLQCYLEEAKDVDFVELQFPNPDIITNIVIHIRPQENSPYFRTKISFSLAFCQQYPMKPPKLKCLHRIYHPNINYNGNVCLPLVREDWSPTVSLFSIVCGLIYILSYPDGEDALQPQIGDQMKNDMKLYKKIVDHTIQGRNFNSKVYDKIIIKE